MHQNITATHSLLEMAMKIVCVVLIFLPAIVFCTESPCTTPNGETAICKDLTDCAILLQAVASKDSSLVPFFKASNCGNFMVCCGNSANFTAPEVKPSDVFTQNRNTTKESHELQDKKELLPPSDVLTQNRNTTKKSRELQDKKELLPPKQYCGIQHFDDYSDEGNATTSINEYYPWLLYLSLYNQRTYALTVTYELRCVGVIISNRYALTAAECNALPFDAVRIGQHDRFKDIICETIANADLFHCDGPFRTVEIEERIKSNNGILLLRFAEEIEFSDYARPICLPIDEDDKPKVGDELTSSGWGDVTLEDKNVKGKKNVTHILKEPYGNDFIHVNSINYTNCFGDEGGPLMHRKGYHQKNWVVDAIIPPFFCLKNTPARRINQETIDWILENIRP